LSDIIYDHRAVGVAVVHGCQRLVTLLACRVPYLELDCRCFIECDGLGEEGGADGRFSIVVELILKRRLSVSELYEIMLWWLFAAGIP